MRSPTALGKCPICGKPSDPKYRPACSQRCSYLDLNRWLEGSYRIPGEETIPTAGSGPESDIEE